MSNDNILDFYQSLGFEETEIEDGLMVLGVEFDPEGTYALITDAEGGMPANLQHEIIFAYYTADDSFLWSASFKSSAVFKDIWTAAQTSAAKLAAIREYREQNQIF